MRNLKLFALLCALVLLVCSCRINEKEGYSFEEMTQTLEAAVAEGHFFFAGKVLSVGTNDRMISYYEMEAETNTVYQVEVTEDFFGCMPKEPITVCIYGTTGNFSSRSNLEKGKEYLFDTTLWVQGEEIIFLLPSFYEGMPERAEEALYYTAGGKTALVNGTYVQYKEHLFSLAEEKGYGPQLVKSSITAFLEQAVKNDAAFFEGLGFTKIDTAHLAATTAKAALLLEQVQNSAADWAALREILK
ncbi:MAG: hypothetical protein IJ407_05325 [Clostridia bacterium]|nr:hypothetical protein [Clostridia bacterium]